MSFSLEERYIGIELFLNLLFMMVKRIDVTVGVHLYLYMYRHNEVSPPPINF